MTMLHYELLASSHKDDQKDSLNHRKSRLWFIKNSQTDFMDHSTHDARPESMLNISAQEMGDASDVKR